MTKWDQLVFNEAYALAQRQVLRRLFCNNGISKPCASLCNESSATQARDFSNNAVTLRRSAFMRARARSASPGMRSLTQQVAIRGSASTQLRVSPAEAPTGR